MTVPEPIGVVGAGTMGLGIAQLAAQAGARTLLHDPVPDALAAAPRAHGRGAGAAGGQGPDDRRRGRGDRGSRGARRRTSPRLAPCAIVIEAAPERLELKHELFAALAGVVDAGCVLATNTSSLSVTELAAPVAHPERVVGLHFFNPAPVMRLVEVVAGQASSAEALATARAVGQAMGKHVIDARDIAGFLVNRVNRPFSLESLRLLQEGVAGAEQIDRIVRLGGGFRMGPFELMDLIGIDTNHAVAEQFHRQTYGEPRYRPSPLAARMVAAGTLGRKTGSGWFAYAEGREHRPPDPEPPPGGGGDGRAVSVTGEGAVADALRAALAGAGFDPAPGRGRALAGRSAATARPRASTGWCWSTAPRCTGWIPGAAGFHLLPPLRPGGVLELTATADTPPETLGRARELAAALGQHAELVGDAPGLVLGRIACQLVNEAAFLIGEGNGTARGRGRRARAGREPSARPGGLVARHRPGARDDRARGAPPRAGRGLPRGPAAGRAGGAGRGAGRLGADRGLHGEAVAAGALDLVERAVGGADHGLGVGLVGERRHAHADRDQRRVRGEIEAQALHQARPASGRTSRRRRRRCGAGSPRTRRPPAAPRCRCRGPAGSPPGRWPSAPGRPPRGRGRRSRP